MRKFCLLLVATCFPCTNAAVSQEIHKQLLAPVQILAADNPIDVKRTGHSAPCFADFDGDGLRDLIVGEYYEGRVRVFKNHGTQAQPLFQDFEWIVTEAGNAKVPSD